MLTFCKSGNSLIRSSVPIRNNGRSLFTSGRYAINLHLIASYDVVSRVNMDESNKRNLKIIIAVIAANIVIRILIYYIISK